MQIGIITPVKNRQSQHQKQNDTSSDNHRDEVFHEINQSFLNMTIGHMSQFVGHDRIKFFERQGRSKGSSDEQCLIGKRQEFKANDEGVFNIGLNPANSNVGLVNLKESFLDQIKILGLDYFPVWN